MSQESVSKFAFVVHQSVIERLNRIAAKLQIESGQKVTASRLIRESITEMTEGEEVAVLERLLARINGGK